MISRDNIGKLTDAIARAAASLAGFKAKGLYAEGIQEIPAGE